MQIFNIADMSIASITDKSLPLLVLLKHERIDLTRADFILPHVDEKVEHAHPLLSIFIIW